MERLKKGSGQELLYLTTSHWPQYRLYNEYINQQRKIENAHSVIAQQANLNDDSYQKARYELQYEFHRLKQRR